MAVLQLHAPSDFIDPVEKRWDEVDPVTRAFVAANAFVSGVPWRYLLRDTVEVRVNLSGPRVRRKDCSDVDVDCNFWLGDPVLVARDRNASADLLDAPIRLTFSSGVRAVGAWLGACPKDPFDSQFFDQPLTGAMWVALERAPDEWHLVRADGWTGHVCAVGEPLTAPFVGARALAGDRIVEVRFDVALLGNRLYDHIAVSELTVEP